MHDICFSENEGSIILSTDIIYIHPFQYFARLSTVTQPLDLSVI